MKTQNLCVILTDQELCDLGIDPLAPYFLTMVARDVQDKAGLNELPRLLSYKYNQLYGEHEFQVQPK